MQERLQKILSARGIASRRKAEEYIRQGLVKVNGNVAKIGDKADVEVDRIEVDGKVLEERKEMLYFVMNKPLGVETTNARPLPQPLSLRERGVRRTVRDLLPKELQGKVFPVGRLDKDSSGLLIFTNDGVLAYRLTHPGFSHEKEYDVSLDRAISSIAIRKLQEGFELDGSMTKPLRCKKIEPNRVRIILTEGRNRQIRRMCQHVGYTVKSLSRVRIQTLEDPHLKPGDIRPLSDKEKTALLASVAL
ncbi:rRNA pseudouridine synthase [Candidatus Peregrinibacteria bacterium]|nr:rRNA pseudouridine synthase [Candidatus Peregrinibacteria bacterium]